MKEMKLKNPTSEPLKSIAIINKTSSRVHRRVVVKADQEIYLECGKSSLLMRKDGTIILKGVKVISRASQTNKVRGGSVKIN